MSGDITREFDPYYQWLGIPPEAQPADYYRLLGLSPFETNLNVISNAADQRMFFIRMFQNGPHSFESQSILNELAQARITLLNPQTKAEYDKELQSRMLNREMTSTAPPIPDASPESISPVVPPPPLPNEINCFSPLTPEELALFQDVQMDGPSNERNASVYRKPEDPFNILHSDITKQQRLNLNLPAINSNNQNDISGDNAEQVNVNSTFSIILAAVIFGLAVLLSYLYVSTYFPDPSDDEEEDVFYKTSSPFYCDNNTNVLNFDVNLANAPQYNRRECRS